MIPRAALLGLVLVTTLVYASESSSDEEFNLPSIWRRVHEPENGFDLIMERFSTLTPILILTRALTLTRRSFFTICLNCRNNTHFRELLLRPGHWEQTTVVLVISMLANLVFARLHLTHHRFVNFITDMISIFQTVLISAVFLNGDVTAGLFLERTLVFVTIFVPFFHYYVMVSPPFANSLRRLDYRI